MQTTVVAHLELEVRKNILMYVADSIRVGVLLGQVVGMNIGAPIVSSLDMQY